MGCKRASGYKRKGLKKVSTKRRKNIPAYDAVKDFIGSAVSKSFGRPDGTGNEVVIPCACGCGDYFPIRVMEPHHITGRIGTMLNGLNRYWAPTNIVFISHECHERETNRTSEMPVTIFLLTPGSVELEAKIIKSLPEIAGEMKWSDADQGDAILFSLGLAETCDGCGNLKCECEGDGERPVE